LLGHLPRFAGEDVTLEEGVCALVVCGVRVAP